MLPKDHKVDGRTAGRPVGRKAERGQVRMQELYGPEVHIQIELETQPKQNVTRMLVAGHAWIPERAQKDSIHVVTQMLKRSLGECFSSFQKMIGGIGQAFPR